MVTAVKDNCTTESVGRQMQHLFCTRGVMSLESCRCTRVSAIAYLRKLDTSSGPCARERNRGSAAKWRRPERAQPCHYCTPSQPKIKLKIAF